MLQFCVKLKLEIGTVSKLKWGYKLQNFLVAVSLDPLASYLYTALNKLHLPAAKA